MKPLYALLLATVPLSGCATVFTPARCDLALHAGQTAQDIIAVLVARGVEPVLAAKIGEALVVGQITVATACAASGS